MFFGVTINIHQLRTWASQAHGDDIPITILTAPTSKQIIISRAVPVGVVGAGLDLPFEKIRPRWADFFVKSSDLHEFHPIEV